MKHIELFENFFMGDTGGEYKLVGSFSQNQKNEALQALRELESELGVECKYKHFLTNSSSWDQYLKMRPGSKFVLLTNGIDFVSCLVDDKNQIWNGPVQLDDRNMKDQFIINQIQRAIHQGS